MAADRNSNEERNEMSREEDITPPPVDGFDRQSSFYMAFIQAGANHPAMAFTENGDEGTAAAAAVAAEQDSTDFRTAASVSAPNLNQQTQNPIPRGPGLVRMPSARVVRPPGMSRRTSSIMTRAMLRESRTGKKKSPPATPEQQERKSDPDSEEMPAAMPSLGKQGRQPSWFYDAMNQGGMSEEDMHAFLGVAPGEYDDEEDEDETLQKKPPASPPTPNHASIPEPTDMVEGHSQDEVMEQYRIMAHVEAGKLFKKLTGGCDVDEYIAQKQQKREAPQSSEEDYLKQQRDQIQPPPPLRVVPFSNESNLGLSETTTSNTESEITMPPLPPLSSLVLPTADTAPPGGSSRSNNSGSARSLTSSSRSINRQQQPGQPPRQLRKGKVLFREMIKMAAEKGPLPITRCFNCNTHLQVDPSATMVACPSCATISPNTSTRR